MRAKEDRLNMPDLINVDYYKGSYGPTIRFDLRSPEALTAIKGMLKELSSGKTDEYRLHELEYFKLSGMQEFYLKVVSKQATKTVQRKTKNGKVLFQWCNSPDGWDQCVGLIEGISGTIPSHQYLSDEGIDDALIVVAYMER